MSEITVLRVTAETETGQATDQLANRSEVSVIHKDSLADAKDSVDDEDVDCLVTAHDLPDGTGMDLIRYVRETSPDTGCILFTDADRQEITANSGDRVVMEYVDRDSPEAHERLVELVSVTARRSTQTAYPLPGDEDERLAALERFDFDSPSLGRALERVSDLAGEHFDVDRTAVNVIADHVQEVLASRGTDWTAFPREETICTYSILDEGVTVIEDVSADPRFEERENLEHANIRFYAGVPLSTDDGLPIGTLCIYDSEPRELSADGRHYLQLLAEEAMQWIELHSRLSETRVAVEPEGGQ